MNLFGTIYGTSPVQAEGTINGHLFYFRARHDEWTFSISESSRIDPVDIQTIEYGKNMDFSRRAYTDKTGQSLQVIWTSKLRRK